MSTWNHFEVILQHFGVILGYFGFTLSSLWRKLAEVGAKFGLSWPNLAPKLAQDGSKFAKVEPKMASNWYFEALWLHFGVALGTPGGHFGVTLGVFRIILDDFGVNFEIILST